MRRERRGFNKNNMDIKRILYTAGGVLSISLITFIAMFLLNSGNDNSKTKIAEFNTEIMSQNSSFGSSSTEEASKTSSQTGKTVNEMANEETNQEGNNNTNNTIEEKANNEEETKKYAVNTSSSTDKKVEESKEEEKEETEKAVKDPEFTKPVEGEIIREYAKDNLVYSATLDEWITHAGIDIAAAKTTVVKASADGTVKSIKNDPRYGLTVVIEHVNGFTSVYSNLLTAEFIKEGEKVEQGQTIATVGNTATFEIADEPHLHFEILKNNEPLDPELYMGN